MGYLGLLLAAAAATASPAPWGALRPGPHAVGLRVLSEVDHERRVARLGTDRPIQIAVWYPALRGRPALAHRDYLALQATETGAGVGAEAVVADYKRLLAENGVPADALDRWLAAPLTAARDARPAPGRFPLVLVAQGNFQSAYHQAALAEHLASHGYVVATCPSQTRISGPMENEDAILGSAEEQADDLAFVLRRLRAWPGADAERLGVLGHSFGARSALLFAMEEPAVDALVSLDGGIGARTGKGVLERSRRFHPARRLPVLHVYEDADEFMAPDFDLLRSLAGERLLVRLEGMRHVHFTALGLAAGASPELARAVSADADTPRRLAVAVEYARCFLDAHVRGLARARADLAREPAAWGLPPGLVTVQRWPAR
jgi:dienelactone hydrolase